MYKTITLYFIFSIFSNMQLSAQQPTQEWVARYQGPSSDVFGPFLQVDKQGNSYIAGTHFVNDSINILCAKYNTNGVQLWSVLYKYPGEGYFIPTGLAIDSSGNAYVISGFAQTAETPRNSLIVKFNSSNGNMMWVRRFFGGYSQCAFFDIEIDRLNNIYVVGSSDTSHLVIRYNSDGDSVWVRKFHPPGVAEYPRKCVIDDSLNIVFTGYRRFFYPPYGYYDSLLVGKYSSNGILRWESVYAYNLLSSNVGTKITADQNGNIYIGGETAVSGNTVYLTLKYDKNGSRQWAKIYYPPGSVMNDIYGIALNRINNELYVTGYSVINSLGSAATIKYNTATGDTAWVRRGFGVPESSSAWDVEVDTSGNPYITGSSMGVSSSDLSTLKYNSLGNSQWLIRYNGPFNGGDGGRALEINQNNVYVLGYSKSSSQISDYIIIKYNQLSGISPISNTIPLSFNLEQNYPNPFNPITKINFSIPKKSLVHLRVYDILGREVTELVNEEVSPGEYSVSWDASMYSSGIYIYRIEAGDFVATKKMIILK